MTEYCRLCANLKYTNEIVASIDNDSQLVEQKLRACCQWKTENIIEHRLPLSVCAICLDELNKSWLFSQSVQLAQQQLLEIFETKPLAIEIYPTIHDSSECLNDFPNESNIQNGGFNQQSLRGQRKRKSKHNCEICSLEFCTVAELKTHRQHAGCEGLIEINSMGMDCKPTAVDFMDSDSNMGVNENQAMDNIDDDYDDVGSNIADEESIDGKSMVDQNEYSKLSEKGEPYPCDICDRKFASSSRLKLHAVVHRTKDKDPFKCQLCDHKPFTKQKLLKRHLVAHVNNSKGELKIEETINEVHIIPTNGGDPIYLGVKIYKCAECDRIYDYKHDLKVHLIRHVKKKVFADHKLMCKETFKCRLCGISFTRKIDLRNHLVTHAIGHDVGSNIADEESINGKSMMNQNKRTKSATNKKRPKRKITKKPYPCDVCDRKFASSSGLRQHTVTHRTNDKDLFKCQLCDRKPFGMKKLLKRHLVAHVNNSKGDLEIEETVNEVRIIQTNGADPIYLGVKIYKCAECDRIYDYKHDLKVHLIRHVKRKMIADHKQNEPFKCRLCGISFKGKMDLRNHLVTHVVQSKGEPKIEKVNTKKLEKPIFPLGRTSGCDDDNDHDVGTNIVDEESINGKSTVNQNKRLKSSENKKQPRRKIIEKAYPCDACDRKFQSLSHLKQHAVVHNKKDAEQYTVQKTFKAFKCQLCDRKPFTKLRTLQCHLVVHVNNSKGELKIDGESNETRIIQTNGGDPIDLGVKIYKCAECDRIYHYKPTLKAHLMRHVKKKMTDYKQTYNGQFECPLCDILLSRKRSLCDHLVTHVIKSKGELKIEKVNKKTKKPMFRIVHANGDGDPIRIPGKVDLQKCEQCDRVFICRRLLDEHLATHANERPFECCLCHKTFKTHNYLKAHSKTHATLKRNWICELCGKAFPYNLSNHIKSFHSNERPFKCDICDSKFKTESSLKIHHLTHTKELQFKCNQCGKSFRSNYSLKQHLVTHTGTIPKPHVCDFCGMGFRRTTELMDHRSTHTGEKRFKCEHCGSNFGARSSFYTHMRKVHGISLLALKQEKLKK